MNDSDLSITPAPSEIRLSADRKSLQITFADDKIASLGTVSVTSLGHAGGDLESAEKRIAIGQAANILLKRRHRIIGGKGLLIQVGGCFGLRTGPGRKALRGANAKNDGSRGGDHIFPISGPKRLRAVTLQILVNFIKNIGHLHFTCHQP